MAGMQFKMGLLVIILFSIVFGIVSLVAYTMGITSFYFYLMISVIFMLIQYLISPKLVEWGMRVKYVTPQEAPDLHSMITELSARAGIPKPRVGIAQIALPNAFAFGRWTSDGRVCVTQGIMNLLSKDELRAVLAHEISHLKNRDVLTITLLSVIPIILYRIAWHTMFFGGGRRSENNNGGAIALVGFISFLFYLITNLLVLYASRIREYFADYGSVKLGNRPSALASALYKLVYGSARTSKEGIKEVEGLKAFFANDPSRAFEEFNELKQLDLDKSGTIDESEMEKLRRGSIKIGFGAKTMEVFSTHPNMLKRIQKLATYERIN
ncbi:MAG: zinc metalloprotease HtpX [bacterium]